MKKSTQFAKTGEVERKWVLIDADGRVLIDADGMTLGRLATQAAMILRGKNKPQYTPNADTGDFVIVINADKVVLTGNKANTKSYWRYSGYLGGLKTESFKEAMAKHPERVIEHAVKGMLQAGHEAQGLRWPRAPARRSEPRQDRCGGLTDG